MKRISLILILCCLAGLFLLGLSNRRCTNFYNSEDVKSLSTMHEKSADMQLVIYNRVPKTGSTALVNLVYQLRGQNDVGISLMNMTGKPFYLSRINQLLVVRNLSERNYQRPFFLHGHFTYLDFQVFGSHLRPIYMNMIRDPLERLVSYYYFRRFGDDYRMNMARNVDPGSQNQSFDDCVRVGGKGCSPKDLWVQIPLFCGNAAYCRVPGNRAALEMAKQRVTEDYLIVGLSEAFDDFVVVLERLLPRFFRGSLDLIQSSNGWRIRRTRYKPPISNLTRNLFQRDPIWQMEQEFYEFVRKEFWDMRNLLINAPPLIKLGDVTIDRIPWNRQKFKFTRIKP